jgi:hypothetical protein
MTKTTRRNLLRAAAAGGAAAVGLGPAAYGQEHAHGKDRPLSGNRAQATVAFGQWDADPANPFDRQPVNSDRFRNVHAVLPFEAVIEEGGAVSFIISGVHQVAIYSEEATLEHLQSVAVLPANQLPGVPPLFDYEPDRVYRGLDPRVLTYATLVTIPPATTPVNLLVQDRVETVNFPKRGKYLVICSVVPHLLEGMHGYVRVK